MDSTDSFPPDDRFLSPVDAQSPAPGLSTDAVPAGPEGPSEAERGQIRRIVLRRLRLDGFGGWLFFFLICVTLDLSLCLRTVPLLVESLTSMSLSLPLLALYVLTRLWLMLAVFSLLGRRPGAARRVRFALAGRLLFAILLLATGLLLMGERSPSGKIILPLAILSMLHDAGWWLYFRLSRRVRVVLEERERPQLTVVPDADCPPYGSPEPAVEAAPDMLAAFGPAPDAGADADSAPQGTPADDTRAQNATATRAGDKTSSRPVTSGVPRQDATHPPLVWMVLFVALAVLLWQTWQSARGVQEAIVLLSRMLVDPLSSFPNSRAFLIPFALLCLSPLVAVAGYCELFALMLRVPNGRALALRLGVARCLYWVLSISFAVFYAVVEVPAEAQGTGTGQGMLGNASGWAMLVVPTLLYDLALLFYTRNARGLRDAFPALPGTRALADFCSRRVTGPGPVSRLSAATLRAEGTYFTGVQGWMLVYAAFSVYIAMFCLSQVPWLSPAGFAYRLLAALLPNAAGVQNILFWGMGAAFSCLALVHLSGALLTLKASPAAPGFNRGLHALLPFVYCAAAVTLAVMLSPWLRLSFNEVLFQALSLVLPGMAVSVAWFRYFGGSRRIRLTCDR